MLRMIIFCNVDENIIKTYEHNNSNNSSNFKRSKLISLFINNKSSYFEQFIKMVKIIQNIFNDIKNGDVLSILLRWKIE